MARTVSRSGDNGESTPVAIPALDGIEVEHKADPRDVSAARASASPSFKGMQDIETGNWVENLMDSTTIFTSAKGSFKLAAKGFHGSVQTVDESIKRDAYLLRAVQRNKIRFLNDEEAMSRIEELVDEEHEHGSHLDHLMESMDANASSRTDRYKKDLPEDAIPNGPSLTPEQIWAGQTNKPESPKNFHKHATQGETEFIL